MIVCPACQHTNPPHGRFCLSCGRTIPARSVVIPLLVGTVALLALALGAAVWLLVRKPVVERQVNVDVAVRPFLPPVSASQVVPAPGVPLSPEDTSRGAGENGGTPTAADRAPADSRSNVPRGVIEAKLNAWRLAPPSPTPLPGGKVVLICNVTVLSHADQPLATPTESFRLKASNGQFYYGSTMAGMQPTMMRTMDAIAHGNPASLRVAQDELGQSNWLLAELAPGGKASGDISFLVDADARPVDVECYDPWPRRP